MTWDTDKDICAGHHGGHEQSQEAFEGGEKSREIWRKKIFGLILKRGVTGLTCDEAEEIFNIPRQKGEGFPPRFSPRFAELKALNLIWEIHQTRQTRNGKNARVCVAREVCIANEIPQYISKRRSGK